MPFFIETYDNPEHAHIRQDVYQEHLDYLEAIAPKLLACGAKLNDADDTASGGVYLVDVETNEAAQQLIEDDPFYRNRLFADVKITRWRKAYLDGQSFL